MSKSTQKWETQKVYIIIMQAMSSTVYHHSAKTAWNLSPAASQDNQPSLYLLNCTWNMITFTILPNFELQFPLRYKIALSLRLIWKVFGISVCRYFAQLFDGTQWERSETRGKSPSALRLLCKDRGGKRLPISPHQNHMTHFFKGVPTKGGALLFNSR